DAAYDQAFLLELIQRLANGRSCGPKRHRELALRRKLIAVGENAGFNRVAEARRDGIGTFGRNKPERFRIRYPRFAKRILETMLHILATHWSELEIIGLQ